MLKGTTMLNSNKSLILGALGLGLVTFVGNFLLSKKRRKKWVKVGVVDQLWVFPMKGARGKPVNSAEFQRLGLKSAIFKDRSFCLIKDDDSCVFTKEYPKIALLELVFSRGQLCLKAPGCEELPIKAADLEFSLKKAITIKLIDIGIKTMLVGKEYDEYISQFVTGTSKGLRLVYQYSDEPMRPVRPKYQSLYDTLRPGDAPAFNFTSAYTILTNASMSALNEKLDKPIAINWLRSSIIIETDSKEPFQEDQWTGKVRLGQDVQLHYNKPCNRCAAITIDPETGIKNSDQEPLKTLISFRLIDPNVSELEALRRKTLGISPLFAVNYSLDNAGIVNVGDEVYIEAL